MVALADFFRGTSPTQAVQAQPGYAPTSTGGPTLYAGGSFNSAQSYSGGAVQPGSFNGQTSSPAPTYWGTQTMTQSPMGAGPAVPQSPSYQPATQWSAPTSQPQSGQPQGGQPQGGQPQGWSSQGGQSNVSAANQVTAPTTQQPPPPAPPPAPPPSGIINSVAVPPPAAAQPVVMANYERIDPSLRTVQENETVRGQLAGILDENSPLLQQARARALEQMQSRGLLNSSIAIGAGEDALIGRALQIAQPDAATYAEAAKGNQDAINAVNRYNQSEFGLTSRANADAQNQRGDRLITEGGLDRRQLVDEAGQDRRLAVTEAGSLNRLNISERGAMDRLNVSEAGQTNRLNISEAGALNRLNISEAGATNRLNISEAGATRRQEMQNQTQLAVTQMNNDVSMATASMSRDTQLQVANLQASTSTNLANIAAANQQALATSAAANALYRDGVQNISSLLTNPDLDGATRARLIANQEALINQGLELTGSAGRVSLPSYLD